jgi:hypothetical protein
LEDVELDANGNKINEDDSLYAYGKEGALEQNDFTPDVMDTYLNAEPTS